MDKVAALPSKAIYEILLPTFKIFTPLLQANSSAIKAIPKSTLSYGPHPRQQLDIYTPPPAASSHPPAPAPILIFLYGGGLSGGDRILLAAAIPDSLVYTNLGAFFASRDFLTLIPDYRRVNDPKASTGEDAAYPSGAADLAAVLEWLASGGLLLRQH
jgi:acetyl esterase/lipase